MLAWKPKIMHIVAASEPFAMILPAKELCLKSEEKQGKQSAGRWIAPYWSYSRRWPGARCSQLRHGRSSSCTVPNSLLFQTPLKKWLNGMEVTAIEQLCILCKIAYQGETRRARTPFGRHKGWQQIWLTLYTKCQNCYITTDLAILDQAALTETRDQFRAERRKHFFTQQIVRSGL